jgi:ABC-type glycerol-3-phosphate transport system permease component
MKYYQYLSVFVSAFCCMMIAPFVAVFYIVTNNKSSFSLPGLFQQYSVSAYNDVVANKLGSNVSLGDAIIGSVLITILFMIVDILIIKKSSQ